MTTVAAGVAGGVGLAMATSGWLESLLFRTRITDPGALLLAAGISLSVAVLASASPARNAAAKSPMDTLRTE
jgi:ABC-type antimicrobial peptide transport system permease subunit